MLISIDHGNKQVKTIHHAPFTSGLVCSEVRPFGGETLTYQGRYYTLTTSGFHTAGTRRRTSASLC